MRLVKSSLTVIGYPKLARANASDPLAPYIQTRRPPRNRRQPPTRRAVTAQKGPARARYSSGFPDSTSRRLAPSSWCLPPFGGLRLTSTAPQKASPLI